MSTVRANNYYDAAGGNAAQLYGVSMRYGGTSFVNRIINGDMRVWQRGTSFSGMTPSLGVTAYSADRWYVAQLTSQSATDVTQQTTGATRFAIRVQKRAGSTGASANILGQVIENLNCLDLPGQQVTLSFTARAGANYSASSNALAVQILTCTTADQSSQSFVNGSAAGQATLLSQNVTLTTSNQRFTLTTSAIPANATNLCLLFVENSSASAAGANDWFEISDVQIEAGSVATPFERRPFGAEELLCDRYARVQTMETSGYNTNSFAVFTSVSINMRTTPTITQLANNVSFTQSNVATSTSLYIASSKHFSAYRIAASSAPAQFSERVLLSAEL